MIRLYKGTQTGLDRLGDAGAPAELPAGVSWIDLFAPTAEESDAVSGWLNIEIPSREEMQAIEVSSRLYEENGVLYMTFMSMVNAEAEYPATTDIAFILTPSAIVTVRHAEPKWMTQFMQRCPKLGASATKPVLIAVALLEAVIDRVADVLEKSSLEADAISRSIFERHNTRPISSDVLRERVARISRVAVRAAKARESLVTISRVVSFLTASGSEEKKSRELKARLAAADTDAEQLANYTGYLSDKTVFLLDATVSLINIEQNNIIKIFSIAATTLMPPTVIASIYGMNFHHMPELDVPWAYPAVLLAMLVSAIIPYIFFRIKGWL
ncbi:MAG: magnesium transporter CorA family protein [Rhodobiaceae bacterium]|nr:magnesium transporter CorA family protein [Rhodobiaceae bacterium]MCC0054713.1 magnesium transporter CorA family protein [Rhodobiaceae bacterium]